MYLQVQHQQVSLNDTHTFTFTDTVQSFFVGFSALALRGVLNIGVFAEFDDLQNLGIVLHPTQINETTISVRPEFILYMPSVMDGLPPLPIATTTWVMVVVVAWLGDTKSVYLGTSADLATGGSQLDIGASMTAVGSAISSFQIDLTGPSQPTDISASVDAYPSGQNINLSGSADMGSCPLKSYSLQAGIMALLEPSSPFGIDIAYVEAPTAEYNSAYQHPSYQTSVTFDREISWVEVLLNSFHVTHTATDQGPLFDELAVGALAWAGGDDLVNGVYVPVECVIGSDQRTVNIQYSLLNNGGPTGGVHRYSGKGTFLVIAGFK